MRSGAQPPIGSTWELGSVSEPRPPVGCSPRVRPFPPPPPPEVAFLCSALPRYYDLIRLLTRVHARRTAFAFPSRPGTRPGTGETSQVPRKELLHVHKVSDCARFFPWKPLRHGTMLPSRQRTRSAPRNETRFAAQYLARGLPCERFTAALANRVSCITRGRGGWLNLPRGGLAPPILCQLPGALGSGSRAAVGRSSRGPALDGKAPEPDMNWGHARTGTRGTNYHKRPLAIRLARASSG